MFRKAVNSDTKLRLMLCGPAGSEHVRRTVLELGKAAQEQKGNAAEAGRQQERSPRENAYGE